MTPSNIKQYAIITGNYWVFTLTDGALRMLIVLYFHQLGYTPIAIASLFLFYEFFGVITNLLGGWLGAKWGLNKTMHIGIALQTIALSLLLVPNEWLTVVWVMCAQALSGIAKDLNKMSAKSAIKSLIPSSQNHENQLYRWVAILTGSKNTLKGVGFFMGGGLLATLEFRGALFTMIAMLLIALTLSAINLEGSLGKAKKKPKLKQLLTKNSHINYLSAARFFLFGARDIWFVIAAPLTLSSYFAWPHTHVGIFFATWVIFYGIVQANTPRILKQKNRPADAQSALIWSATLLVTTLLLVLTQIFIPNLAAGLVIGLFIFGGVFAINSAIHSYLIVSYADSEKTSMDIGFYYMANAAGRLTGTILSGTLYQYGGLLACLICSSLFLAAGTILTLCLKNNK